jgi:hypothetical protein
LPKVGIQACRPEVGVFSDVTCPSRRQWGLEPAVPTLSSSLVEQAILVKSCLLKKEEPRKSKRLFNYFNIFSFHFLSDVISPKAMKRNGSVRFCKQRMARYRCSSPWRSSGLSMNPQGKINGRLSKEMFAA